MHGHETPTQGPWQFWSIAERQSAPPSVCRGAYALSRLPLEPWPRGPGPELADPAAAKTRLPDSHWEGSSFLRPAGRAAPPSSARTAGPLPPLPPGRPGRSPLLRPDGRAAVRGGGGAAGGGGGGWLAAVGRTCGGIELGVVAAPAPFGKDGRFWRGNGRVRRALVSRQCAGCN